METIQSILTWHEDTFPFADLISQRERVWLELEEFLDSVNSRERLGELADAFISWIGLLRFNPNAKYCILIYDIIKQHFSMHEFVKAVQEKMIVNRIRARNNYWEFDMMTHQYIASHKIK